MIPTSNPCSLRVTVGALPRVLAAGVVVSCWALPASAQSSDPKGLMETVRQIAPRLEMDDKLRVSGLECYTFDHYDRLLGSTDCLYVEISASFTKTLTVIMFDDGREIALSGGSFGPNGEILSSDSYGNQHAWSFETEDIICIRNVIDQVSTCIAEYPSRTFEEDVISAFEASQ